MATCSGPVSAASATDPRFAGWTLAVAEAALTGPLQVAIAYAPGQAAQAEALVVAARQSQSPGLVLAHGGPDTPGIPLLAGRPLVRELATAYVCRGFVCDAPVTELEALRAALA